MAGLLFAAPANANYVLEINATSGTSRQLKNEDYGAGTYKYHWHTVANNGMIYSVPDHARFVRPRFLFF